MYNYDYINDDLYRNDEMMMLNSMTGIYNGGNMPALFTPATGYDNGNMFSNLYKGYKNYKPDVLKPKTEKDKLLIELGRNEFAAHELNLYLDLHPTDTNVITLFNEYRVKANNLREQYESKYGPLNTNSNSLNQTPFAWEGTTWPWEENYYV